MSAGVMIDGLFALFGLVVIVAALCCAAVYAGLRAVHFGSQEPLFAAVWWVCALCMMGLTLGFVVEVLG